jgi:hypothetical protein
MIILSIIVEIDMPDYKRMDGELSERGSSGFLTQPDTSANDLNRQQVPLNTPKIDEPLLNVRGPAHIGSFKDGPTKDTKGPSHMSVPSTFSKQGLTP